MSEYIPFEIQAEILKRLPLKPLIQFRSVSKSYKCLIDSPDFIVSYHGVHRPPQPQDDDRFILRYSTPYFTFNEDPVEDKYLTFVDNGDHGFVQQEFIPKIPDLVRAIGPFSYVVGGAHGLLCFKNLFPKYPDGHIEGKETFVLWNPSIRKSVGIRLPHMSHRPNENIWELHVQHFSGFGVCPVTFDPTILSIHYKKWNDVSRISFPWKVRVFTLSTGTWSILSTNLPRESIRLRGSQVVIGRFIYWVAQDTIDAEDDRSRSQSHFLIMSFDLTAKEFKEINLPDNLTKQGCRIRTISKLQESLVLLEYHDEFEEDVTVCCLWMMKEQGVSRTFTKLYTINLPDATINEILGFRKTGELIMETQQNGKRIAEVQTYEWNSEYADNLGVNGEEYSFFMCSYMETLLLLDQSDGYIHVSSNSM